MRLLLFLTLLSAAATTAPASGLFPMEQCDASKISVNGNVAVAKRGNSLVVTIPAEQKTSWPGISLRPQNGGPYFDLSGSSVLAMELKNLGDSQINVKCQIENKGANGRTFCTRGGRALEPGESGTLRVRYYRDGVAPDDLTFEGVASPFEGMKGGTNLDVDKVVSIMLFSFPFGREVKFEVSDIRLEEPFTGVSDALKSAATFYPAIDRYGQYKHKKWPGKTGSDDDLRRAFESETADLAANPRPAGWNRYGGWEAGPSLKATGYFRTEKYDGKWYLVDPAGKLFFSHGIDQFERDQVTGVTLREHYFEGIPAVGSPEARGFYRKQGYGRGGSNFYQKQQVVPDSYDFFGANLRRKYGRDWKTRYKDRLYQRAASWGVNTMANWTIKEYAKEGRMPYVVQVSTPKAPVIPAHPTSPGRRFQDVFDPRFEEEIVTSLRREWPFAANDPMCIGFFVDNEHNWGNETLLAEATIQSPRETATKQAFRRHLERKYRSVAALNRAWNSDYASFDAFLDARELPDRKSAGRDLTEFNNIIAARYFEGARNGIRRFAPDQLYLGCRFATVPYPELMRIAARYCDVVSMNIYQYSIEDLRLPEGSDKPILIGEFHFGTLANGNSHSGCQGSADNAERGNDYFRYLAGALRNPQVVGTHYYRLIDQSAAGRSLDNENYGVGFLDICDRPYPEMVEAARRIGRDMYELRSGMISE